jgi:hypothetical protein
VSLWSVDISSMDRSSNPFEHRDQLRRIFRHAGYTAVLACLLASLPYWARVLGPGPKAFTGDGGAIEWVQFSILIATAALWGWGACRNPNARHLFLFLAFLTSVAAVRELDYVLDHWIPVFTWKAPALVSLTAAVVVVWAGGKRLIRQGLDLSGTPAFSILWAGLVTVVLFSQMVGHGPFLTTLFAEQFVYEYKRLIEEMGEVFGYLLILIGTIEVLCCSRATGGMVESATQSSRHIGEAAQR